MNTAGDILLRPRLRGNVLDVADADGKFFFGPIVEIAGKRVKGWEDYKWPNPVTRRVEPKSTYFRVRRQFDSLLRHLRERRKFSARAVAAIPGPTAISPT